MNSVNNGIATKVTEQTPSARGKTSNGSPTGIDVTPAASSIELTHTFEPPKAGASSSQCAPAPVNTGVKFLSNLLVNQKSLLPERATTPSSFTIHNLIGVV